MTVIKATVREIATKRLETVYLLSWTWKSGDKLPAPGRLILIGVKTYLVRAVWSAQGEK